MKLVIFNKRFCRLVFFFLKFEVTFVAFVNNELRIDTYDLRNGKIILNEIQKKLKQLPYEVKNHVPIHFFDFSEFVEEKTWNFIDYCVVVNSEDLEKGNFF